MINTYKLELPLSRKYFHGSKGVRAIEVLLYVIFIQSWKFDTAYMKCFTITYPCLVNIDTQVWPWFRFIILLFNHVSSANTQEFQLHGQREATGRQKSHSYPNKMTDAYDHI